MVLVWDMLVLDIEVLAMLDTDMVSQLMDTQDLDITARDLLMLRPSLRQRLMLDFSMEDMDMVLVLDMVVLAMLDMDMVSQLMDTLDSDIMARDLLMLSLRLMLDIFMVDMDMVWDTVVLDTDMVVLDMDILIMVKLYLPSFSKQKLKDISDWQCNIQCPGMKGRNCFELINKSY